MYERSLGTRDITRGGSKRPGAIAIFPIVSNSVKKLLTLRDNDGPPKSSSGSAPGHNGK